MKGSVILIRPYGLKVCEVNMSVANANANANDSLNHIGF